MTEAAPHSAHPQVPRSAHPLAPLRDPATIRERCAAVLRAVASGVSPHFSLDRARLPEVAERVATLTRLRFPDLRIPFHSRWRHFEAGGIARAQELDARLAGRSIAEQARARFDLTMVSVLLDAGAGARWRYTETAGGPAYARSEGLGVASFRAFMDGRFSDVPDDPLRVDATALLRIDVAALQAVFQSSAANPLVGVDGRVALLQRLGRALQTEAAAGDAQARPGLLYDRLSAGGTREEVSARQVLAAVLDGFSTIWPGGSRVQGLDAGDVWRHPWAGAAVGGGGSDRTTDGWVPFHKLSQWLSYSLLEPLQAAGLRVSGLDGLTGLPEYRNGGLLIDAGVLLPRDERLLARAWKVGDEFVVEWRALTVVLLDELAVLVRERLERSADELPLACVLEGGTWAAGRAIALERRADGSPPVHIDSDGTVF